MFDGLLGGMGDIQATGKAVVEGFEKMLAILGQIRDEQVKSRELLERIANNQEGKANAG